MEISIIFKSFENQKQITTFANKTDTKQLPKPEKTQRETFNHNEFIDWKKGLESDFKAWLDELDELPEIELLDETPDIYSFYEELTSITNEMRKGNRKNSESLSHFNSNVNEFIDCINNIKDSLTISESSKVSQSTSGLKDIILSVVEILERMTRMQHAIAAPQKRGIFGYGNNRNDTFGNIKKGISILVSHLESLLKKEGVNRIKTIGCEFDPARMIAVEAEMVNEVPANFVAAEISPGYLLNENVLKFAEVKVSKGKEK